jgi:hypothetical protein
MVDPVNRLRGARRDRCRIATSTRMPTMPRMPIHSVTSPNTVQ